MASHAPNIAAQRGILEVHAETQSWRQSAIQFEGVRGRLSFLLLESKYPSQEPHIISGPTLPAPLVALGYVGRTTYAPVTVDSSEASDWNFGFPHGGGTLVLGEFGGGAGRRPNGKCRLIDNPELERRAGPEKQGSTWGAGEVRQP